MTIRKRPRLRPPAYVHIDAPKAKGFAIKLADGVYQFVKPNGLRTTRVIVCFASKPLLADPAAQWYGLSKNEIIDPLKWPVRVTELEAEFYGDALQIKEKQKCRICKGDARVCYPRHSTGRSCG